MSHGKLPNHSGYDNVVRVIPNEPAHHRLVEYDHIGYGREQYAGFWLRAAATLLDGLILLIPCTIVYLLFEKTWAVIILAWIYGAVMESSKSQATIGKRVVGICVTDIHGKRLIFGAALLRRLGMIISSLILGIGFLLAGWTEKKQALHDMFAGTLVIRSFCNTAVDEGDLVPAPKRLIRGLLSVLLYAVCITFPPAGLAIASFLVLDDDPITKSIGTTALKMCGLSMILALIWLFWF